MSVPARIRRRRSKGWRMPPNAVFVGRPTKWGNPFRIAGPDVDGVTPMTRARAIERFRSALDLGGLTVTVDDVRRELAGKDLACWCAAGEACHADVLLEVANG